MLKYNRSQQRDDLSLEKYTQQETHFEKIEDFFRSSTANDMYRRRMQVGRDPMSRWLKKNFAIKISNITDD